MTLPFILVGIFLLVVILILFSKKTAPNDTYELAQNSLKVYGHIDGDERISPTILSKIALHNDRIVINDVAIIPLVRVEKATFDKLIEKEETSDGATTNYYFGRLTIFFTSRDGETTFLTCETKKKNQFNLISQYELIKKRINERVGNNEESSQQPLPEPYEL